MITGGRTPGQILADELGELMRLALYPYQRDWVALARREPYVAHLGGRQIGKDHTYAFVCTSQMMIESRREWQVFSATDDKAMEFLADCKRWVPAIAFAFRRAGIRPPSLIVDNVHRLGFSNGSIITSRAPTLRRVVGVRDSVLLNEIGVVPGARGMIEGAYPVVSEARSQGRDARYVLVSNASRVGSDWHAYWMETVADRLSDWRPCVSRWSDCKRSLGWSEDKIAAERSRIVRMIGLGAFLQWYECEWRSAADGYLAPSLLDACGYDPAELTRSIRASPQIIGHDIGRKIHPSAWAQALMSPAGTYVLPPLARYRMAFADQRRLLDELVRQRPTRLLAIDASSELSHAEKIQATYPAIARLYSFSRDGDRAMTLLKAALESGRWHIPRGDLDLRVELEGVEVYADKRGRERLRVREESFKTTDGRTEKRHGDKAIAVALTAWGQHELDERGVTAVDMHSNAREIRPRRAHSATARLAAIRARYKRR
jgi:hypothetical protein